MHNVNIQITTYDVDFDVSQYIGELGNQGNVIQNPKNRLKNVATNVSKMASTVKQLRQAVPQIIQPEEE